MAIDPNIPGGEVPLKEKDFIQEGYSKNPFPFWLWLFLITAFVALIWGSQEWIGKTLGREVSQKPFLAVTNRDMSLFLWQNSAYMRANSKSKNGYLTGFQYVSKVTLDPPLAENFVVAPPNLLFHYQTWNRLLKNEFIPRTIKIGDFLQFLDYVEEWQPDLWKKAPPEYIEMVQALPRSPVQDLNELPESSLPRDVRIAFIGWKNYIQEGKKINETKPTYAEMQKFLTAHPHYARNFWRNIVDSENMQYLKTLSSGSFDDSEVIPDSEIAPFLRVAFYNWKQSQSQK